MHVNNNVKHKKLKLFKKFNIISIWMIKKLVCKTFLFFLKNPNLYLYACIQK